MTFGHGVFDSFGADTLNFGAESSYGPATITTLYNTTGYKANTKRYLVSGKFHQAKTLGNQDFPAGHEFSYARDSLASAKSATSGTTSGMYKVAEVWESDLNTAWPASGRDTNTTPTLQVFSIENGSKVSSAIPAEVGSWGAWSEWSESSSCKESRSRSRPITRKAFGSGIGAEEGNLNEVEERDIAGVDEVLSDWSDWGVCTDGKQTRTRSIDVASSCGGSSTDPATHTETQDCTVETDNTTDTNITAQSTTVTPVVATSGGMSGAMQGILAVGVLGGGFLYMKNKKAKKSKA